MSCWSRDRASTSSGCTLCASARVQFSYIQLCLCGFTHQLPRKSVVFDIFCSSTFFYSRRNTANAYNICILLSIIFALKCILDSSVFCSQVYLALQCILFYSSEVQTILVSGVQHISGRMVKTRGMSQSGSPASQTGTLSRYATAFGLQSLPLVHTMMLECQTSKQGFLSTSNG